MTTTLWRISNHCDLTGLGGERADGRWHTAARGKRIVYLSEHPALALIENLANLKGLPALFPDTYQLMRVEVEEQFARGTELTLISNEDGSRPTSQPLAWTQKHGDAWLASKATALACVPSYPSPYSANYLLNPLHPNAQHFRVAVCERVAYDRRLFKTGPAGTV